MRYKVAPGPVDPDLLAAVHGALPLVPAGVSDCCARVVDRTAVANRDDAREWIAFLEALGLAEETPRGYRRVRADLDATNGSLPALGEPFAESVFGARELLAALEESESLAVETVFDRLRSTVPAWERDRHVDWEAVWRERVERLLEWGVAFGLAARDGDRYRLR